MGERGIFKQPCQCFPFELNKSKAAGPVDGLINYVAESYFYFCISPEIKQEWVSFFFFFFH